MFENKIYRLKNYLKFLLKKSFRQEIERIKRENSIENLNIVNGKPSKNILVLRRLNTEVGTFSDYVVFLKSIEYAIETGKIPIVDRQSVKNIFMPADDSINTWELFFQQPCGMSLVDIDYTSMNVSICNNGAGLYPVSLMRCDDEDVIKYWRNIAKKYIRLEPKLQRIIDDRYEELLRGKRVLGVSIREGYQKLVDMKSGVVWGHPKQMNVSETLDMVDKCLKEWNLDYVFFTCQTNDTVKAFKKRFGEHGICLNRDRVDYEKLIEGNSLKSVKKYEDAVENEREYITEIYLLSMCNSMICSDNSGSEAAFIISEGFEHFWCYDNGTYT